MVHRRRSHRYSLKTAHPEISVRVPMRLKCTGCEYIILEGRPLKMVYEKLGGPSTKIGSLVHRFYLKCPQCGDSHIIRSELMYNKFVCEHACTEVKSPKVNMKHLNRLYSKTLDPFKLTMKHFVEEDTAEQQDLVESIEKHLEYCKMVEGGGLTVDEKLMVAACNSIRKECKKGNTKTPLLKDDGQKTSPFIQKLMKVQSKDLESFMRSIQEVLNTRLFRETAYGYRERLIPIILRYQHHMEILRNRKVIAHDVVDLASENEDKIPFLKALEAHGKACIPTARNIVSCPHVLVPFSMKCKVCKWIIPKGRILSMRADIMGIRDFSIIRTPVYRLSFACPNPKCKNNCIFRSNLQQTQFFAELGVAAAPEAPAVVDPMDAGVGVVNLLDLLDHRQPLDEDEDGVVQAVEDYLENLNWAIRHGKEIKTILSRAEEMETTLQEEVGYTVPLFPKSGTNVKFSDTLTALPDYHFTRFTNSLRLELVSFALIHENFPTQKLEEKELKHFPQIMQLLKTVEPTPVEAAPSAEPQMPNSDLQTSPPATAPVQKASESAELFPIPLCRSDLLPPQMMIVPTSVKCNNCGNPTFKNQRVEMRQEWLKGLRGLPVNIYRLYMRCVECTAHITLRSELVDRSFRPEYGGTAIQDEDRVGLNVPAFNPANLIGRWPKDTEENLTRMEELEGKLNNLLLAPDDSETIESLKEKIKHEMLSECNHPQLEPVPMPDAMSRSPFVAYFLSTPLHSADMFLMRQQLRTEEFRRVISEPIPDSPFSDDSSSCSSPDPKIPVIIHVQQMLMLHCPRPSYENLFKMDRPRNTELRRVELVERLKKSRQLKKMLY